MGMKHATASASVFLKRYTGGVAPSEGQDQAAEVRGHDAAAATWVTHQVAEVALREVLEALTDAGVRAVAVKGIVLSQTLYADVAERPIQDVDLRVLPEDLSRAIAAGKARHWELDRSSRQTGAVGFLHPHMLVELETSIGPPGLCALTVADLLARARPRMRPSGVVCLEPELHDHALVLVVNAFKDKIVFCPPWSLRDTATIVESPGFDAAVFCSRVREAGARTMTAIVAAHFAASSPAWRAILARLGPAPRPLYVAAYQALVRRAPASAPLRVLGRLGSDRTRDRVHAIAAAAVGSARAWTRRTSGH
jgi:hypothetical protein